MQLSDKSIEAESFYKTLLESTKAIPWKIDWSTMRFTYIGPQIERLLGWTVASWASAEDWAARIHPDERSQVVNFCIAQSQAGIDHEADYRALKSDGGYVWMRDVVHVVRKDNGEVDSLIGFMFDISERKKNEDTLLVLQQELEALTYKDSLTGVANRRMFDSLMDAEWRSAVHHQRPLSLIMIDIDYFKEYNDYYGHLEGDECLKRVAQILNTSGTRARDFFARFGGEEFTLVLPETSEEDAIKIAERCRTLIYEAKIPHQASKAGEFLTISLGVATTVPLQTDELIKFVDLVDKRLYHAKRHGRNCVSAG